MIPYGRQSISEKDIQAVVEVLHSDYLTQGPVVPRFERALAEYSRAQNAVAANSATSALHLACRALGISDGDMVWTTPISFVASANCAIYCGADIDFVDIEPDTFNMSVGRLEEKLKRARSLNSLPRAVIPVHLCGLPCDMAAIGKLAKEYNFSVIEDASHAVGARYLDEPVGNCRYSDITVFSFHPVKIITTGEGGVALTNNAEMADRMTLLASHGITRDPNRMTHEPDGDWYYQQIELGYNYRMTDIQAALGLSQMSRLNEFITRRHEIAELYDSALAKLPVTPQYRPVDAYSAMHLYVIRVNLELACKSHRQIFEELRAAGIGVNLHYIPIHLQPWYAARGFQPGDFPESERYYSEAISLPMYPDLTDHQVDTVIQTLLRSVT